MQRPENSALNSKNAVFWFLKYHVSLRTRKGIGGAMRDRTADLLDANQALSQLSYSPFLLTNSKASQLLEPRMESTKYQHNLILTRLNWWVWVDSNHRPHPYQGCALTNWATDPLIERQSFEQGLNPDGNPSASVILPVKSNHACGRLLNEVRIV